MNSGGSLTPRASGRRPELRGSLTALRSDRIFPEGWTQPPSVAPSGRRRCGLGWSCPTRPCMITTRRASTRRCGNVHCLHCHTTMCDCHFVCVQTAHSVQSCVSVGVVPMPQKPRASLCFDVQGGSDCTSLPHPILCLLPPSMSSIYSSLSLLLPSLSHSLSAALLSLLLSSTSMIAHQSIDRRMAVTTTAMIQPLQ